MVGTERTRFVALPLDVAVEFPGAVTFVAEAVSDADTPVTYTWYHDARRLVGDGVRVAIALGNLTLLRTERDDLGVYRCVASNGVSSVNATARLHLPPDTGHPPSNSHLVSNK